MSKNNKKKQLEESGVKTFLKKVASAPIRRKNGSVGRLIFAMDATASRQPTWDQAAHIQTEMFLATSRLGGLDVQLAFFRGFGEFKVSQWTNSGAQLLSLMRTVHCSAGETQIGKVLQHAINQTKHTKLNALVYVGDSMEEDIDKLGKKAGELGLYGVPAFMFQEGKDYITNYAYKEIAKLSGGACVSFDSGSVEILRELLTAVAVYAAGGRSELEKMADRQGGEIKKLTQQIGKS